MDGVLYFPCLRDVLVMKESCDFISYGDPIRVFDDTCLILGFALSLGDS